MTLSKEFIEWNCSLSGCDGGNPKADVWLSGIEWGYRADEKRQNEYYKMELPMEIGKGKYVPSTTYDWKDSLTYPYGRSVAKLYSAIIGREAQDYRDVANCGDGSEIFRMNLYPIAFSSTNEDLWLKFGLDEITGFKEKQLFKTWCFLHRFPAISDFVNECKPKLIIGTGISYLTDFFVCFAGMQGVGTTIASETITPKTTTDKPRKLFWAKLNNGATTLVVIPFFSGASGLNSDHLLQETGSIIRKIC